ADLGAGLAADETVQMACQLALGGGGVGLPQQLDDGETEHAVTDELQALVVLADLAGAAQAGVGQRAGEQRLVLETVAEPLLQRLVLASLEHRADPSSDLSERD